MDLQGHSEITYLKECDWPFLGISGHLALSGLAPEVGSWILALAHLWPLGHLGSEPADGT